MAEKKFERVFGKKVSKEEHETYLAGWRQAYQVAVKGGLEIVYGLPTTVLVYGEGNVLKGRRRVWFLEKMPPKEVLFKEFGLHQVKVRKGKTGEMIDGTYGVCDGHKFFVPGKAAPAKPAGRSAKAKK